MGGSKIFLLLVVCLTLIHPSFADAKSGRKGKKVVHIKIQPTAKKPQNVPTKKATKRREVVAYHYSQQTVDDVQIEPLENDQKVARFGLDKSKKKKKKLRTVVQVDRGPDQVNRVGRPMPEKKNIEPQPIKTKELQGYLKDMQKLEEAEFLKEIEGSI